MGFYSLHKLEIRQPAGDFIHPYHQLVEAGKKGDLGTLLPALKWPLAPKFVVS